MPASIFPASSSSTIANSSSSSYSHHVAPSVALQLSSQPASNSRSPLPLSARSSHVYSSLPLNNISMLPQLQQQGEEEEEEEKRLQPSPRHYVRSSYAPAVSRSREAWSSSSSSSFQQQQHDEEIVIEEQQAGAASPLRSSSRLLLPRSSLSLSPSPFSHHSTYRQPSTQPSSMNTRSSISSFPDNYHQQQQQQQQQQHQSPSLLPNEEDDIYDDSWIDGEAFSNDVGNTNNIIPKELATKNNNNNNSNNHNSSKYSKITVAVRKRPLNQREKSKGDVDICSVSQHNHAITVHEPKYVLFVFGIDRDRYSWTQSRRRELDVDR